MKTALLLSQKYCIRLTGGWIIASLALPLVSYKMRHHFLYYCGGFTVLFFLIGFLIALIVNWVVEGRLRMLFPLWKEEIGERRAFTFLRSKNPHQEEVIQEIIKRDPAYEKILQERKMVSRFTMVWIYLPTILLTALIIYYSL